MNNVFQKQVFLIAEDDSDHFYMIKNAFKGNRLEEDLFRVTNGVEAMDYLLHQGKYEDVRTYPRPLMVILDLNLPKKDGRAVLKEMKASPSLEDIPVAILTTSINKEDEINSYNSGAKFFFKKPVLLKEYINIVKTLKEYCLHL